MVVGVTYLPETTEMAIGGACHFAAIVSIAIAGNAGLY